MNILEEMLCVLTLTGAKKHLRGDAVCVCSCMALVDRGSERQLQKGIVAHHSFEWRCVLF